MARLEQSVARMQRSEIREGQSAAIPESTTLLPGYTLRARWRNGEQDELLVRQRIQSWIAHAAHADTRRLRQTLFRGGWFDPARLNQQPFQYAVRPELVEGHEPVHVSTGSTRTDMGSVADSTEGLPARAAGRLVE